jgi:predicted enzyme related to lactoylglutathione lyase
MSDQMGRPTSPGAVNGGMGKKSATLKVPTVTVSVTDIDETLANIKKLGGKVVEKKSPVGDMGFTAYFADPEGNVIGLWQDTPK